ncbi:migration and invasion-inhibitory protein isoform X1 [Desmodus rotundus]|uniref:migration and invasion-inhibitory protein isoform X1 n=1 Tax=Desmodus rotundus TaxID=9430 RepID=UPI0023817EE9|nr:migration and invasion-inhibitory protein isoform X1 [Desmodus rotundus]XP_045046911.2 migration and invasion-inhibitory protein isoform X1 [Desmodus rotundus]
MEETKDLAQLRQLNLELLRQLWVGQDAMQRSVAKAAAESSQDSSSSYSSEMPSSQERSSMAQRASCPQDASQRDPCNMSSSGGASSGVISLPPSKCQHQESLSPLRPCLAPLGATSDSNDPERSAGLEAQGSRSILDQQSKLPKVTREGGASVDGRCFLEAQFPCLADAPTGSLPCKPRVTFNKESPVPEKSWRLRPYLGYDWIAGSLDNTSPISDEPEDFFSRLQEFREANRRECIHSDPNVELLGLWESAAAEEDHECVYCYRVSRRLFLVPWDPGTPCRLCRTARDQQNPETLSDPARVRVSVPLSILDPPHRYRIHRRKSLDACDSLALPGHCLLGWDILPPKSESSSALKSLDLWSCVASEAQRQKLSVDPHHPALPLRVPPSTLIWSEP